MAIQFSTGLKDGVLGTGSLKSLLDDGILQVYAGTVPDDADAALGGAVLLVTYTDNDQGVGAGQGLDLATPSGGAIGKEVAQVWSGTAVASNTATFFRFVTQSDSGNSSTTDVRIQGTVGGAGADMFVQSTTFSAPTLYTVDFFSVSIPA